MSNNAREEILSRIRTGLTGTSYDTIESTRDFTEERIVILRETEAVRESLTRQFLTEVEKVNGNTETAADDLGIEQYIIRLIKDKNLRTFSIWESEYLKALNLKQKLKDGGLKLITAKNKNRVSMSDIGITEADYAISDTGTMVLLANKNQPRSISLLPPIHLAVVKKENIVRNIHDLFVILKDTLSETQELGSCMTFITGPSRTADIELNLTLGVHGSKELYVIIR